MNSATMRIIATMGMITAALVGCSDSDPIRGQFISGCMHAGAPKSDCQCIFGKLEEKYGREGLDRMSMEYPPNNALMESTMKAALACRN
ncbi:MAG: hypothetical protein CMK74_20710 [Pseudomonadales bacterium]|nr:hypothetical protein [Pseudomonadales bacterium]|tara:strand:+ start:2498 stop:2764 length:267 start_codon:yes stop_codon:yes gene_type:complete